MMSFLDKLKKTAASASVAATNAANVAVKQTKAAAAIGKLKLSIAQEEDKMKKAYIELGRIYYRDHETGAEMEEEEYLPWLQRVSDAKAAIAELNAQVEAVKNAQESEVAAMQEPQEVEDTSIYVDFAETEPIEVMVNEPETVEAVEESDEETVQEEGEALPEADTEEPGPTIGTLYVDISGQE